MPILDSINTVLWNYILVVFLLLSALYYTIKTRGVQFAQLGESLRLVMGSDARKKGGPNNHVSSLSAFFLSMASRVGTGNLVGVAVAITIGGPGAVFWMWITSLVGAATGFVECTLAQIYKQRGEHSFVGGAAHYIELGLGKRKFAMAYSLLFLVTFSFIFTTVQSNTMSMAFKGLLGLDSWLFGTALCAVLLVVCHGGIRRVTAVCNVMVPLMAAGYFLLTLYVMAMHITELPATVALIVKSAFGVEQAVGGGLAAIISQGVRRGLFSNDAGMGSIPAMAATAHVSHPVKQGLIQSLGVLVDTIVICSCTAFIILLSGVSTSSAKGIGLVQAALHQEVGQLSVIFVTFAVFFFCFSCLLAYNIYGEHSLLHIGASRRWINLFHVALPVMAFVGSVASLETVWQFADIFMALMTFANLLALLRLHPKAVSALNDYIAQRKAGKDPTYHFPYVEEK